MSWSFDNPPPAQPNQPAPSAGAPLATRPTVVPMTPGAPQGTAAAGEANNTPNDEPGFKLPSGPAFEIAKVVVGGALGLFVGYLVLVYGFGRDPFGLILADADPPPPAKYNTPSTGRPRPSRPVRGSTPTDGSFSTTPDATPFSGISDARFEPNPFEPLPADFVLGRGRRPPQSGESTPTTSPPMPTPPPMEVIVVPAPPPTTPPAPPATTPAPRPAPPSNATATGVFTVTEAAIELPPPVSTGVKVLAQWTTPSPNETTLELLSGAAALPDDGQFRLDKIEGANSPQWRIFVASAAGEGGTPLAQVTLDDGQLSFQWSAQAKDLPYRQLRNCLLKFAFADRTKVLGLRAPIVIPAPTLGFDKKVESIAIDIADPPATKSLHLLIIDDLDQWPASVSFENNVSFAELGKPISILMKDLDGAAIEVKLVSRGSEGVAVNIAPEYRETAALVYDLTVTRLGVLRDATTKSLASAQQEGPVRVAELKALQAQLADVMAAPAPTALLVVKRKEAIDTITGRIQTTARKITSLQKKIPEYQARLQGLPKLEAAVASLAGKARLRFKVVAALESREVVLVDATK